MRCNASWRNGSRGGGVFVSSPAYADGYVDGTGNNIYYGFKTDAKYAEAHFNIDVEYYDTFEHAKAGGTTGIDPLGKFVRVHYLSNCNNNATADDWRFRPMWWFGVPAGLKDPQDIQFKRIEKLTKDGNKQVKPAGSSQYVQTDANGYGAVSDKHFNSPKEWNNISNFYFSGENIASKGWKRLVGLSDKAGSKTYDNAGDTEKQWNIYKQDTQGLKGIFVDWESAGRRWYDMTYVSEMEDTAWKNRDKNPLRFAAGVYRFAGNWHYAVGQKHNTPKIADHFNLTYPAVTKVKDTKKLTGDEQTAVKEKIENANKNAKYYSDLVEKVEVSEKGVATITFKDKTTRTMPASLLVTKDETDSDKYKPTLPDATPVVNLKKLTSYEKTKIRQAIIDANGKGNPNDFLKHIKKDSTGGYDFKVADNGDVSVEYQDGSKITIPAEDLVFQGPKIADWAPYVVPDAIEVTDPAKLNADEQKKVTDAFDKANADLDVYTKAKKEGKTPVSFDDGFKNAIITWADGSTTEIPSWQFLKKKAAEQTPTPKQPTPKPAEEKKMFTVDLPDSPTQVTFDPFDKNATVAPGLITTLQDQLKKRTAKDANDASKSVTITSATISIADGTVTFTAEGYEKKVYPIGIFYKKKVNGTGTQNPTTQKDEDNKDGYKYKIPHVNIAGDSPTLAEGQEALKKFVELNYNGTVPVIKDDGSSSTITIEGSNLTAKDPSMAPYGSGNGHIVDVMVSHSGGDITINYDITPVDDDDTDHSMTQQLFINSEDIYIKKNNNKDNTIDQLKALAKQIRDQRKKDGELTEDAINTLGATDEKINSMTDEKDLRELIKKISDYQKPKPVEYKYNFEKLTLDHEGEPNDADYKKIVVEQFLKKNYTTDNAKWSTLEGAYSNKTVVLSGNNANTYSLTPVTSGTSGLNIYTGDKQAGGVTSVIVDSKTGDLVVRGWKAGTTSTNAKELICIKKADLFTPKPKDQTPTPSAEDLKKLKEQAKEIINRNPKLTDDQKTQYKNEIDQADTKDKIQDILKKANEQAGKNNVKPDDIKKKEKEEKEKRENEQKEKDKKEREKKQEQQLQDDKKKASDAIGNLGNLSDEEKKALKKEINGDSTPGDSQGATTPEAVKKILDKAKAIDGAKGALQNDITKGALPFLDHGNFDDSKKGEASHADDVALHELLGGTPGKDQTLTDLDKALTAKDATAESINNALAAAQRQNAINEENAKNAGIAKLDAKKAELDAAYNALPADQQAKAKKNYDAAINAINDAKTTVDNATKPSDIMTAVNGVDTSLNAAKEDIKNNTPKRDTSGNTNDNSDALTKEKNEQKKRIQDSNLPDADKKKAIDDINNAKKLGDPTGIADRALKAKKIADALDKLDKEFKHLNNAQRDAFKAIINGTDAGNHKDDNGNDTGVDDIDDALANAANTDNAMARLEELKKKANDFKNEKDGKYSKLTNSEDDQNKKKAFDSYLDDATKLTTPKDGDAKGAAEVNTLYNDLLKAMRDIDPQAKSAGLKTAALKAEIDSDNKLKPNDNADPKTPGDSVYTTASADKKDAFDKALNEAQTVLNGADTADISDADKEATEQNEIDAALDKLIKARLALDGVNTKPLQDEIDNAPTVKGNVSYTKASADKKKAYDDALEAAQKLIAQLTGKDTQQGGQGAQQSELKTKEQKQQALDAALKALRDAAAALDGKEPTPVPPSDDDNTGSGSESDSGSSSDSGSGTSTSTGNGVNKQNLINQINTTENPGGANPGSGAAGTNPSTPGAGAQGAGMGAVAPGSGAGAAGTGAAGAASAGVDNKAVNNAVENAPEVKQADAAVKQAAATLDEALAQAKRVAADPHATQAQVDAAAAKLADARKALADAQANAAKVRAAVRSRVIKGMRSRGNAGIATGANVATTGLMATMIAAIGGAFATRRMRTKHANRD